MKLVASSKYTSEKRATASRVGKRNMSREKVAESHQKRLQTYRERELRKKCSTCGSPEHDRRTCPKKPFNLPEDLFA